MSDKIKEAIDVVKNCTPVKVENQNETVDMFRDALIVLSDLAERYLSCGEKMPEKLQNIKYPSGSTGEKLMLLNTGYNKALDECALITTKLLAEKDNEIYRLKFQNDCKSELCECADRYGFPCYRHLQEAYNDGIKEIERLKGKIISLAFSLPEKQLKKLSKQEKLKEVNG